MTVTTRRGRGVHERQNINFPTLFENMDFDNLKKVEEIIEKEKDRRYENKKIKNVRERLNTALEQLNMGNYLKLEMAIYEAGKATANIIGERRTNNLPLDAGVTDAN